MTLLEAIDWVNALLRKQGGRAPYAFIADKAFPAGITKKTLKRIAQIDAIEVVRVRNAVWWKLRS